MSHSPLQFRGRAEALDAAAKEISDGVGKGRSQQHNSRHVADPALVEAVTDFSDIIALAKTDEGFIKASEDKSRGIQMFTRPVPQSPIHMMKARVVMPCNPREFLAFLELDKRGSWDDHYISGYVLDSETRRLQQLVTDQQKRKRMNDDGGGGAGGADTTTTSTAAKPVATKSASEVSNADSMGNKTALLIDADTPSVWLKYMAFKSPVPVVVRKRDFEFIVGEQVFSNGTAVLKAFSPQEGRCRPHDSKYVRGVIEISGFVAEPLPNGRGCQVTYVALVDPRGLVPPAFLNILVGKQTATLAQMQRVIAADTTRQRSISATNVISGARGGGGGGDGDDGLTSKKKAGASFLKSRLSRSHL